MQPEPFFNRFSAFEYLITKILSFLFIKIIFEALADSAWKSRANIDIRCSIDLIFFHSVHFSHSVNAKSAPSCQGDTYAHFYYILVEETPLAKFIEAPLRWNQFCWIHITVSSQSIHLSLELIRLNSYLNNQLDFREALTSQMIKENGRFRLKHNPLARSKINNGVQRTSSRNFWIFCLVMTSKLTAYIPRSQIVDWNCRIMILTIIRALKFVIQILDC